MNQIGHYYFGLDYDTNYWRISLFPFSFCLTINEMLLEMIEENVDGYQRTS